MNARPVIAITGATGNIGRIVTHLLGGADASLRLIVRDAARAPQGVGDIAVAEYGDAGAATKALRGVDVLFMVSGAESADRLEQHLTFIDAAAAAGVRHVVYLSFLGASAQATFTLARTHWHTEERLRASGMAWTFLRDSFYLDFLPAMAGDDGVIRGPAGDGRVGAVTREDVARSAAAILQNPAAHAGRSYDLTGPQALTFDEVASIVTEVTGKPTTFHNETLDEAYESRRPYGVPDWQMDAWVSTYTAIAAGELDVVTDCVEKLTGSAPVGLAEMLEQA